MIGKRKSFKRAIPAFGLVLVASLALGAIGVASASAATQHWYVGGTKLAEGTPTSVTMKGTTIFALGWTYGGANYEVQCTSQKAEGQIENPVGGGAGTDYGSSFNLSGCTVTKNLPAKLYCTIENGEILMGTNGLTTEFEGKTAVNFSPYGSYFTGVFFEGGKCPLSGLGSIHLNGSFTGIANSATSSLDFTKTSSALLFGGNAATLIGTSKLETTSGQTVTVAP